MFIPVEATIFLSNQIDHLSVVSQLPFSSIRILCSKKTPNPWGLHLRPQTLPPFMSTPLLESSFWPDLSLHSLPCLHFLRGVSGLCPGPGTLVPLHSSQPAMVVSPQEWLLILYYQPGRWHHGVETPCLAALPGWPFFLCV